MNMCMSIWCLSCPEILYWWLNKCIAFPPFSWEDYYWIHVDRAKTCWRFPNTGTRSSADAVALCAWVCVCMWLPHQMYLSAVSMPVCFYSLSVWQQQLKHSQYEVFIYCDFLSRGPLQFKAVFSLRGEQLFNAALCFFQTSFCCLS